MNDNIAMEIKQTDKKNYELKFNIEPLANKLGISKERLAELIADEFIKIVMG